MSKQREFHLNFREETGLEQIREDGRKESDSSVADLKFVLVHMHVRHDTDVRVIGTRHHSFSRVYYSFLHRGI